MANPNLIQQAMGKKQEKSEKTPRSLFVALGIIVFCTAVYFVFFFVELTFDSRASAMQDNIQQAELEINQLKKETEEAQSFVERLQNLESLTSGHIFWTGLLQEIARNTDTRVQYVALLGDPEENSVVLQARASDLAAVQRNLLGLTSSDKVKKVTTSNIVYDIDPQTKIVNVTFDTRIELNKGVLLDVPESIELKSSNPFGGTNE